MLAVSPLSPEGAPSATSTAVSCLDQLHRGFHHPLVDQRRPVRHDLLRLGPPPGEAGDAGWAIENERRDLACEAIDGRLVGRAHADPKLYFGNCCCVDVLQRSEEHTSELQSRPHLVCRL